MRLRCGPAQRWQRIRVTDAERVQLLRFRQHLGLRSIGNLYPSETQSHKALKNRMMASMHDAQTVSFWAWPGG